ncbi:MAG: bifunctional lysylphosphatidylglycerol flippase/synthetase MprF [Verrucomicrobiales bacterium]|nr:bifunctional lysylphosphatidylglycerol flippase/synthetase MprF [Verrucomicrobiales bacterium]
MNSENTMVSAKPLFQRLVPFFGVVIFAAALWVLHREVSNFRYSDFRNFLRELSPWHLLLAVGATFAGYLSLICYDWFAIRYVKQKLSFARISLTAFIGYAFSMNIGHSVLSGGAVRMRLYSRWGIGAGEISRVIGFNLVVTMIGQFLVGGVLFTFVGVQPPPGSGIPPLLLRIVGVVLLLVVTGFFVVLRTRTEALEIRNWRFEIPPVAIAVPAVLVSAVDWTLSALVLFQLMPEIVGVNFAHFLGIFMLAQILGIVSMVPGGLGVFESVVIHLLPEAAPDGPVLSALIAYRAIYYLIPFLLAIVLLAGFELKTRDAGTRLWLERVHRWLSPVIPHLLALISFTAGTLLLISGATPALANRVQALERWMPLFFVEAAHFFGSIVGLGLILLSDALRRRIDAAFFATLIMIGLGVAASLFKGLDYEEAGLLIIFILCLLPFRHQFHRSASLLAFRFRPGWWAAVALALGAATWIGFTSFQRVHYDSDLWLHFGFKGDASRFLRATAGLAIAISGFALWQLLRAGSRSVPPIASPGDLEKVKPIIMAVPNSDACLAFLGDKRFLFSDSGKAFLMFGIQGRSWVAMGEPVGPENEHEELIWRFRELCVDSGVRTAFYQISAAGAHRFASLGLLLFNLGEEAKVNLSSFTLDGPARRNLRQTKSRQERDGAEFEIIESTRFGEFAADFRRISDQWLAEKNATEKGFSLGRFDEQYLRHFDFAVIRIEGKIVAFANLMKGETKYEFSADLMRYGEGAPPGVMEYLFIRLILWGREQGYSWFSLGMAPLSGLEDRALAPVWNKIGARIFTLGEHFYNFQGLRKYKEKFDPEWEPRYLACRSLGQLPAILFDAATLISGGGLAGALGKKTKKQG